MNTIKIKRLVRLAFVLINFTCIAAIIDLYIIIFPRLNDMFNVLLVTDIRNLVVAVPAWLMLLLLITIAICVVCIRLIYKFVCSKFEI